MTKTRSTKRALLMSALALVMCISMLVGSTFAWFTDSVVSGRNKIVAGNLDVVLEYKSDWDNDWATVDENTKIFKEGALYEPGYTEVVYLRVSNAGSLALKYNLMVNVTSEKESTNVNGEKFKLSDYLQIGTYLQDEYSSGYNYADRLMPIMFGTREAALAKVSTPAADVTPLTKLSAANSIVRSNSPVLAGEQTAQVMALVLTMPETVGNEANHKSDVDAPELNLGISLVATQYTDEYDSFGNRYDKDAEYENAAKKVGTYADFLAAIAEGGAIQLTSDIVVEDVSTVISKDTTIDLNGKVITGTRGYNGSNSSTAAVLTVSGAEVTLVGKGKVENATANNVQNYAVLVTGGGKVIIEDGTFIGDESAVYVENGEAIIKGGFFEAHKSTSPVPDHNRTWEGQTYTMYLAAVINCSKSAYINYCNGDLDGVWANVDVSGGTFVNEDPSNLYEGWIINETHVIEGYKVVRTEQTNGDAWYTVVAE